MNFKKIVGGLLTAASIFSMMPTVDAANIKDYPRVAVMEFGNKAITSRGLRDHDFASATEYAIYQLSACDWFDLIDYEQLATMAKMHAINMSGMIDQGTAVQMGKIAGAQFMVIGNVTGLTTKENVFGASGSNIGGINNAQHVVNANVSLRIVDIETGRIVVAGLGKGSSTSTSTELTFKKYRNRRIETEEITNSKTNDKKNEYNKTYNNNTTTSYSKDKNNKVTTEQKDSLKTHEDSSKTKLTNRVLNNDVDSTAIKKNTSKVNTDKSNIKKASSGNTSNITQNLLGDVNGDGRVDKEDEYVLSVVLSGSGDNDGEFVSDNADLDADGNITPSDLNKLKTALANGTASSLGTSSKVTPATTSDNKSEDVTDSVKREDYTEDSNTTITSKKDDYSVSEEESSGNTRDTESYNKRNTEDTSGEHFGIENVDGVTESIDIADNTTTVDESRKSIHYEREEISYTVMIGTVEVSDVQVRNAISKAVRDAVYGNMGIMTTLNNGKKLKVKTGF